MTLPTRCLGVHRLRVPAVLVARRQRRRVFHQRAGGRVAEDAAVGARRERVAVVSQQLEARDHRGRGAGAFRQGERSRGGIAGIGGEDVVAAVIHVEEIEGVRAAEIYGHALHLGRIARERGRAVEDIGVGAAAAGISACKDYRIGAQAGDDGVAGAIGTIHRIAAAVADEHDVVVAAHHRQRIEIAVAGEHLVVAAVVQGGCVVVAVAQREEVVVVGGRVERVADGDAIALRTAGGAGNVVEHERVVGDGAAILDRCDRIADAVAGLHVVAMPAPM